MVRERGCNFSHEHEFIGGLLANGANNGCVRVGPFNERVRIIAVGGSFPVHQCRGPIYHIFQIVYDKQHDGRVTLIGRMPLCNGLQHGVEMFIRFGQVDHLMQVFVAKYAPLGMRQMQARRQQVQICAVYFEWVPPSRAMRHEGVLLVSLENLNEPFRAHHRHARLRVQGVPRRWMRVNRMRVQGHHCIQQPSPRRGARAFIRNQMLLQPFRLDGVFVRTVHHNCAFELQPVQPFQPLAPDVLLCQIPGHEKAEGDAIECAIRIHF